MSVLHLFGINDVNIDGRGIDTSVSRILGYASSRYTEESVYDANDALNDIRCEAEAIDQLSDISGDIYALTEEVEMMFERESNAIQNLKELLKSIESCGNSESEFVSKDALWDLHDKISDIYRTLTDNKTTKHTIDKSIVKDTNIGFSFIPDTLFYDHSPKHGVVTYMCHDWRVDVKTNVNSYGNTLFTVECHTLRFKGKPYKPCYDRMTSLGIDPTKMTEEDFSLLKMVDSDNLELYTLFYEESKTRQNT